MSINFIEYNNIGAIASEAALSADSTGATPYTLAEGKKGISFQNVGTDIAWYGGSDVDPGNNKGHKLFPNQTLVYKNTKNTFKIYFKCASGKSTTIAIVNHS